MLTKQEKYIQSYESISKCQEWGEEYYQEVQREPQNKTGRDRKRKISKSLEQEPVRDEMKLVFFSHENVTYVWVMTQCIIHCPHREIQWEYNAIGMLQCVWNWESCEDGKLIMNKGKYKKILKKKNLKQSAAKLCQSFYVVFQLDNNLKHASVEELPPPRPK